jgi:hypothetical protein
MVKHICKKNKEQKKMFAKTTADELHRVKDEDFVTSGAPLLRKGSIKKN